MGGDLISGPSDREVQDRWERLKSAVETVVANAPLPLLNRIIRVAPNMTAKVVVRPAGDDQRTGNGVSVREYAKLAAAVYDPKWGNPSTWTSPPGWTCIHAQPNSVVYYADAEYVNAAGDYVCAFRGTDESPLKPWGGDWNANILQGMQFTSDQYDLAYGKARHLALRFQHGQLYTDASGTPAKSLTFTGHSLGGGLAALAWTLTGYPTVTFNAAGISWHTRIQGDFQVGNDENQVGDDPDEVVQSAGGTCTNYHVYREFLSTVQWALSAQWLASVEPHARALEETIRPGLFAHAAGHQVMLQRPGNPPSNDPVKLHSITDSCIPALELPAYPEDHGFF